MYYTDLDTPSLLIDEQKLRKNLADMQAYADEHHVNLRPHTKTHKMPAIAQMQMEQGACGIAVAKVGEAEEMAKAGLRDILIANEIVGVLKWKRIATLAKAGCQISFGVDAPCQVTGAEAVFAEAGVTVSVQIEIEVGEERSGIIDDKDFLALLATIRSCPHIRFKGLFSHDGNTYRAKDLDECKALAASAQKRTVHFADLAHEQGMDCEVVSYGATPTFMNHIDILPGITELRPGTYVLMDAAQGHAIQDWSRCAATVLATVISKPTAVRTILDVGAKGLTKETRTEGICSTKGMGILYEYPEVSIDALFDEHAIILNRDFHDRVEIGDKVRIIPVHICPVCNLYDEAALLDGEEVKAILPISCRGKIQ